MKSLKCCLVFPCAVLLPALLFAEGAWLDRFLVERAAAFGPICENSADDVRQFLLLQGRPLKNSVPADAISSPIVQAESYDDQMEKPLRVRRASSPQKRLKRSSVRPKSASRLPLDALLEKSRASFQAGRLDEAQRYYRLVKKADPSSQEASDRLDFIRKELE